VPAPVLLFDFDSTLVQEEGLDLLFRRAVGEGPGGAHRAEAFRRITDRGMAGESSYDDSLRQRLALLDASREQVEAAGQELAGLLSPSVARSAGFFRSGAHEIHVVSGGFVELIHPAAARLGIPPERVHAQRFRYDDARRVVGVDPQTAMALGGKPEVVRRLGLDPALTWVVGDGATDLELRDAGLAAVFVAFVENRRREPVVQAADHVVDSMEQLILLIQKG